MKLTYLLTQRTQYFRFIEPTNRRAVGCDVENSDKAIWLNLLAWNVTRSLLNHPEASIKARLVFAEGGKMEAACFRIHFSQSTQCLLLRNTEMCSFCEHSPNYCVNVSGNVIHLYRWRQSTSYWRKRFFNVLSSFVKLTLHFFFFFTGSDFMLKLEILQQARKNGTKGQIMFKYRIMEVWWKVNTENIKGNFIVKFETVYDWIQL